MQTRARPAPQPVGGERAAWLACVLGLLCAGLAGGGCKSASQYVSPRVEGRVLDERTHEPIKDVIVKRVNPNNEARFGEPPKGAQLIEQNPGVRTSEAGVFALDSLKDVGLFGQVRWYSVTLSFEHPAYSRKRETYTLEQATNTPSGEPLIRAGDIVLQPK